MSRSAESEIRREAKLLSKRTGWEIADAEYILEHLGRRIWRRVNLALTMRPSAKALPALREKLEKEVRAVRKQYGS